MLVISVCASDIFSVSFLCRFIGQPQPLSALIQSPSSLFSSSNFDACFMYLCMSLSASDTPSMLVMLTERMYVLLKGMFIDQNLFGVSFAVALTRALRLRLCPYMNIRYQSKLSRYGCLLDLLARLSCFICLSDVINLYYLAGSPNTSTIPALRYSNYN